METKIKKWGNSLAIRISKETAERTGFYEGLNVEISDTKNTVILRKSKKEVTLKDLCLKITKENRYEEFDLGKPLGKELW